MNILVQVVDFHCPTYVHFKFNSESKISRNFFAQDYKSCNLKKVIEIVDPKQQMSNNKLDIPIKIITALSDDCSVSINNQRFLIDLCG